MSSNLGEFTIAVDAFKASIPEEARTVQRYIAVYCLGQLNLISPVGLPSRWKTKYPPKGYVGGHYRFNWQLTHATEPAEIPGVGDPTTRNLSAAGGIKPYSVIWLTNAVPYAQRLEEGWSTVAPQGIMAVAYANALVRFGA